MTTIDSDLSPSDMAADNVQDGENLLRVAGGSNARDLAAAIANAVYAGKPPKLRAVGAGAVNQAVKACAIAAGYVAPTGRILSFRPGFDNIQSRDGQISAVTLQVLVG